MIRRIAAIAIAAILTFAGQASAYQFTQLTEGYFMGKLLLDQGAQYNTVTDWSSLKGYGKVDLTVLGNESSWKNSIGQKSGAYSSIATAAQLGASSTPLTFSGLDFSTLAFQREHTPYGGAPSILTLTNDNLGANRSGNKAMMAFMLTSGWNGLSAGTILVCLEDMFDFTGQYHTQWTDFDYNDLIIAISPTAATPIPGAVWLLGSGLAGLMTLRRRYA